MDIESNNKDINSYKPIIAGILLLIAGILGMYTWISASFYNIDPTIIEQSGIDITIEQIESILGVCTVIGFIVSIFPILGGILSFKRKSWSFCIVLSILGLFTIGPFLISSILAFIGLILIAISKNEFKANVDKQISKDEEYS
ncbi:hypothetical protein ACFL1L_04610 [Thermoplasmatota archaeon]